jgi:AraC-like DNA-binding protein
MANPIPSFASIFERGVRTEPEFDYPLHLSVLEHGEPSHLDMDAHQGLEINLVLEGRYEYYLEDMIMIANAGDVSLIGSWEPHAWRVVKPETTAITIIFLADVVSEDCLGDFPWLSMFTTPPRDRPLVRSDALQQQIITIGWECFREFKEKEPGWRLASRLTLYRLLFALGRKWTPPRPTPLSTSERASAFHKLRPAVNLVHSNPFDFVTQDQAAAACNLGSSRFARLFRDTVGMTFGRFRLRARMAAVAYNLLYTHKSISTIAEETGFVDSSHLHHAFQKFYNMTPGQFRELRR